MSDATLGYHFRALDGTTNYLREPEVVGKVYRVTPPIRCCENGLHASIRAVDALKYAGGPLLCRTEHGGCKDHQNDKLCSETRRVLWQVDATRTLHEFACWIAEEALQAEEARGRKPASRSYDAIATKRRWLDAQASDSELDAAWSAARSTAWSAAWSAPRSTAWSAAESAAWPAAESAANTRLEAMLLALEPAEAITP